MAAFELRDRDRDRDRDRHENVEPVEVEAELIMNEDEIRDKKPCKEEPIIALKVYDSCRQQDCCTPSELGPARAAEKCILGDEEILIGDIIIPPPDAATVTIDKLKVHKIIIVEKEPSAFKNGFWDIDLKFIFHYRLTFRQVDGRVGESIKACSIFDKKLTLFGSTGSNLVISTDLFTVCGDSTTFDSDPFIMVESKAVGLSAELKYKKRRHHHGDEEHCPVANEVMVTIGLFSIVKLFRLVTLSVESKGFWVPEECEDICPLNPCDFFNSLDFPMDVFSPPQRPEFMSGVSINIPNPDILDDDCECRD